jgi:hypothetical protein
MASGVLIGSGRNFFWNLDANVGPGQTNNPDDVQLIQLAYFCMAANRLTADALLLTMAASIVPRRTPDVPMNC